MRRFNCHQYSCIGALSICPNTILCAQSSSLSWFWLYYARTSGYLINIAILLLTQVHTTSPAACEAVNGRNPSTHEGVWNHFPCYQVMMFSQGIQGFHHIPTILWVIKLTTKAVVEAYRPCSCIASSLPPCLEFFLDGITSRMH